MPVRGSRQHPALAFKIRRVRVVKKWGAKMTFFRSIVLLFTVLNVAGCASNGLREVNTPITSYSLTEANTKGVQDAVSHNFKDPSSAQYRGFSATQQGAIVSVCGEVNGKNSYGGYIGFSPFLVRLNPDSSFATLVSSVTDFTNPFNYIMVKNQCKAAGIFIN